MIVRLLEASKEKTLSFILFIIIIYLYFGPYPFMNHLTPGHKFIIHVDALKYSIKIII